MSNTHTSINIEPNTEALDEWLRALRLLVSQIGFALDGYPASRPTSAPKTEDLAGIENLRTTRGGAT